jgi:SAM-dependent methyltransferase
VSAKGAPPDTATSFFDEAAAGYDRAFDDPGPAGHALRTRQAAVLRLLGDEPPGRALDAGMGPGRLVAALLERGWQVWGIDVSPGMVDAACAHLPGNAERLSVGSIERLPFDDGDFDLVLATGVIEYVDPPRAVAELVRVTRPGGRVIASIPNPRAPYGLWRRHVVHPATRLLGRGAAHGLVHQREALTPAAFARLLRDAGLTIEAAERVNAQVALTPLDALAPKLATALAERLERSRGRFARAASTQVVFAARQPGGMAASSSGSM